jgi:hypothetical protein
MITVNTRVETADEGALTANSQFVPDAAGADVDHAGRDADARDDITAGPGHRLDELDAQVRFDHVDIGSGRDDANRGLVGLHPYRVDDPVGTEVQDPATCQVGFKFRHEILLGGVGGLAQAFYNDLVAGGQSRFLFMETEVNGFDIEAPMQEH